MQIIALFGPTGVGKTAVAVALAELLRARGEDPVAVSADALQVYAGLEILTGVATPAERARLEHRLVSFLPLDATFSVGQYAQLAHAEIDDLLAAGRRPIVVGGTGLYLRAALTELSLRPPPRGGRARALDGGARTRRRAGAARARCTRAQPWAAREIDPNDRQRVVRALELLDLGRARAARGAVAAVERGAAPPDAAGRADDGARRRCTRRSTRASRRCSRRACARRSACANAAGRLRDGPQGARLRGAARGGRRGDEAPHAQLRQAPADVDAQARGRARDRRDRPRPAGDRRARSWLRRLT